MLRCCSTAVLLLFAAAAAPAQPAAAEDELLARTVLPGESSRTARRLAAADKLAAEGKWAEAVEDYQRVLTEAGDDLVPLDARHSLRARRRCHLGLAALPAAGLRLYRGRVDSQAKKWLDQAAASRDASLLRRLVEETFCSSYTDQALDLLGDLAFERADFDEAERWWRMLVLPASQKDQGPRARDALVFPDPHVDEARVRAKQLLARLFRGERAGLEPEWQAFQALHGKAAGPLAGRTGTYAETLRALATQPGALTLPAAPEAWPTFGGDPSRNRVLPRATGRLARLPQLDGPLWSVPLEVKGRGQEGDNDPPLRQVVPPARAARSLAFHPVLVGDRVYVPDARYVTAYKLSSGRQVLQYDLAPEGRNGELGVSLKLPAEPDLSYTLTADADRLYARLGAQGVGPRRGADTETYLVCLNLHGSPPQRWAVRPQAPDGGPVLFEGAPVVHQGRVYVAVTRLTGVQTQTTIACYGADTGALRWQRPACDTQEMKDGERRYRHHLLTLAGPNIVYCSHSGAVVALDAATGSRAWAVRYPSRGAKTAEGVPSPRGLAPCLYADGRVYVAPADFDRLLCLDADTGHLVWESTPIEAIHLLGVAKGRLIFTTTTPTPGIRALSAATGNPQGGWVQPGDGSRDLKPYGRGLLAGDWVFWPTSRGLYVLDQETGEVVDAAPNIQGNLAAANGCLVVADLTRLSAYVPEGQLLDRRRREAAEPGAGGLACYRLALAEAGAGQHAAALADLAGLEAQAAGGERWHGTPLRELARKQRQELLLDAAESAGEAGRWPDAAAWFAQAAGTDLPISVRLQALARQAAFWTRAGQPARAIAVWQSILEDSSLARGKIVDLHGLPQPAALYAAEHVGALIRAHGPGVYEAVEQRARALGASAPGMGRKEVLGRLGREFPNAAVTGPALLRLAHLQEEAEHAGAAAETYRALLRRRAEPERPVALAGLARAYERQHCWGAARVLWHQLGTEQGDRIVAALDPDHPVREWVARRLQRSEYRGGEASQPEPLLPLARAWQSAADRDEAEGAGRVLAVEAGNGILLSLRHGTVTCRDAASGRACWEQPLPGGATWAGCHADTVLVAGPEEVRCFRRADGEPAWSWSIYEPAADAATGEPPAPLGAFRVVGPRLFFLQGGQRLQALDAATGQTLWSLWAPAARLRLPYPSGHFWARYHADEAGLVLQTTGGQYLVLDSRTGRKLREGPTSREPWPRAPVAVDGRHVCLLTDLEHIVLLDLATGAEVWTHAVERPVSLTGELPQVLGNREAVLVLVPRNYGYLLDCLDPQTGSRRWPRARFLGTGPVDLQTAALDETAVYLVRENHVHAYALDDGRPLWARPLPGLVGSWQIALARGSLLVLPGEAAAVPCQLHWLSWAARLWVTLPRRTEAAPYFPVWICDPKSGDLVQSLNLPPPAASLQVRCGADSSPVWVPHVRRRPLPTEGAEATVQVFDRGLAVVCGGRAWALTTVREAE